jgi:hypothetical protein
MLKVKDLVRGPPVSKAQALQKKKKKIPKGFKEPKNENREQIKPISEQDSDSSDRETSEPRTEPQKSETPEEPTPDVKEPEEQDTEEEQLANLSFSSKITS